MGEPSVSKSDAPNPEWPMKDRDGYITVFAVCHVARLSAWRSYYCFRFGVWGIGTGAQREAGIQPRSLAPFRHVIMSHVPSLDCARVFAPKCVQVCNCVSAPKIVYMRVFAGAHRLWIHGLLDGQTRSGIHLSIFVCLGDGSGVCVRRMRGQHASPHACTVWGSGFRV